MLVVTTLVLGARELWLGIELRYPTRTSCEAFLAHERPPRALALEGCLIDYGRALELPRELTGGVAEHYVPVVPAGRDGAPARVLLRIDSPRQSDLVRGLLRARRQPATLDAFLDAHAGELRERGGVRGRVRPGSELPPAVRARLARAQGGVRPDFVVIDPAPAASLGHGFLLLGVAAVLGASALGRGSGLPRS